ncbi:hypothetical protein [[Ruminococcus] torques]|uniref:hypothetical protein n=1 Tax=[Ruminococcus] torques TaxID=33039 RepID=UPI00351FCD09
MNVLEKILEEIDRLDDPYFVGYIDRYKVKEIIRSHMDDQNGDVTEKPSAAALIRAQGQQLRKETVLEYWRRTRGNNNAEMGRNRTEKRIPQGIHKSKE